MSCAKLLRNDFGDIVLFQVPLECCQPHTLSNGPFPVQCVDDGIASEIIQVGTI